MTRALVTGSTGFVGAAICRLLVERSYTVRAFHRATSTTRLLDDLPVEHAIGDLTQPATLTDALQDVDVVFHAAAMLGGRENPGRMYTVTVEGTRAVLQACMDAGVRRMVHTSSVAALGVPEPTGADAQPALMNETHTWNYPPDRWVYGYSKYLAEMEVQKAVAAGFDCVIVNPTLVMGPGDVYRQDSSPIVQIARGRGGVTTDGGVNIVHINEVAEGHLAALERGRYGERYILGGQNLTVPEMMRLIASIAGVQPPTLLIPAGLVRTAAGPLGWLQSFVSFPVSPEILHLAGYHMYVDTRKAQVELGLSPAGSAQGAIQDAYDWFVEVGAIRPVTKK